MDDVARRCGVGSSTVQRALSGDRRVRPRTRDRVLTIAQEMGYDPAHNQAARRLALRRQGRELANCVIGLLMPIGFERVRYFSLMFEGLIGALASRGFAVVVFSHPTASHEQPAPLPSVFSGGEIDGLIAIGAAPDMLPFVRQLRESPGFGTTRPIITMINSLPDVAAVTTDDTTGSYQATRHLLDQGHRHLLHFVLPGFGKLDERLAGVRLALRERRLSPKRHLQLFELEAYPETRDWLELPLNALPPERVDRHPLVERLRRQPELTAVMAINDPSAVHAWAVLHQAGIAVPDALSLIGFDDVEPYLSAASNLTLSTIRLPLREVGRVAATRMLTCIETGVDDRGVEQLATELVVRGSTGRAPGAGTRRGQRR